MIVTVAPHAKLRRYLCNAVRPSTYVAPMFSVWVNEDQDLIPYAVNVYFVTFSIFACVVLHDEALLPIGDIIPVGLRADWEERVASKDQLHRRSLQGRMYSTVDCSTY